MLTGAASAPGIANHGCYSPPHICPGGPLPTHSLLSAGAQNALDQRPDQNSRALFSKTQNTKLFWKNFPKQPCKKNTQLFSDMPRMQQILGIFLFAFFATLRIFYAILDTFWPPGQAATRAMRTREHNCPPPPPHTRAHTHTHTLRPPTPITCLGVCGGHQCPRLAQRSAPTHPLYCLRGPRVP